MGLLPGPQGKELGVLNWERLGAYGDVRIQRITTWKKDILDTTRNK
jgi:hypothetical protein